MRDTVQGIVIRGGEPPRITRVESSSGLRAPEVGRILPDDAAERIIQNLGGFLDRIRRHGHSAEPVQVPGDHGVLQRRLDPRHRADDEPAWHLVVPVVREGRAAGRRGPRNRFDHATESVILPTLRAGSGACRHSHRACGTRLSGNRTVAPDPPTFHVFRGARRTSGPPAIRVDHRPVRGVCLTGHVAAIIRSEGRRHAVGGPCQQEAVVVVSVRDGRARRRCHAHRVSWDAGRRLGLEAADDVVGRKLVPEGASDLPGETARLGRPPRRAEVVEVALVVVVGRGPPLTASCDRDGGDPHWLRGPPFGVILVVVFIVGILTPTVHGPVHA